MSVIIRHQAVIHYEALGRGRPVVFLHGWVGSWRYWISAMQVAATSYRAYALDLAGYGDTSHDPASYSLGGQTDLLEGFLDEMGLSRIALVGHGLGAWVAFAFAGRHPDKVARILAVGTDLTPGPLHTPSMGEDPADLVGWLSAGAPASSELVVDAAKMDSRAVAAFVGSIQADDPLLPIRGADVPCLLINGRRDPSLSRGLGNDPSLLGSNVHQVTLEESGHFPMIDAADRFSRLLIDFLALDSGLSPRELQLKEEWRRRVR